MRSTRHVRLAVLFGVYSALVATIVYLVASLLLGTPMSGNIFFSAVVDGVAIFIVGVLTVLFVWPRIGFDPFGSHRREPL